MNPQNSPLTIVTNLVTTVLAQMKMNQAQRLPGPQGKFFTVLLPTLLTIRGRANFVNLSRYRPYSERTVRRQFRRDFDWPRFNRLLLEGQGALPLHAPAVVAQDASFVKKSGKKTYGLDFFFNGCAGRAERGLEVSLISLVAVEANTAYTFSVRQTPAKPPEATPAKPAKPAKQTGDEAETRMDFYLKHLQEVRPHLPAHVRYAVVDGAFAKRKFVDGVCDLDLHLISKLRSDANLPQLYAGQQKSRGRRRVYGV